MPVHPIFDHFYRCSHLPDNPFMPSRAGGSSCTAVMPALPVPLYLVLLDSDGTQMRRHALLPRDPTIHQPHVFCTPMLAHFVAYALHRTRLVPCITFAALFLLQRFPAARGSSGHRLFSAFVVASKDDTYSNKFWAVFSPSMFQLKETNQMELEMCDYLKWRTSIIRNSSSSQRSCRHANAPPHRRTDTHRHADTTDTHMLMPSHRAHCNYNIHFHL